MTYGYNCMAAIKIKVLRAFAIQNTIANRLYRFNIKKRVNIKKIHF